ncbi:hypothetical protein CVT26_015283 [Gymnopilus dilepis]|uniref:Uncharacterized protein n=1 Tax=Gymnopilus dilepis TaxID=231916 RepID=A0A409WQJ1_9AGAR|nr:hypothetical protein CVT26_015283 [Gymnopilus dilepis]
MQYTDVRQKGREGDDWNLSEFKAYNIIIKHHYEPLPFFCPGSISSSDTETSNQFENLPAPSVPPSILQFKCHQDAIKANDASALELLFLEHLAGSTRGAVQARESTEADFVCALLRVAGYAKVPYVLRTRQVLSFFSHAGKEVSVRTCATLVDAQSEDKRADELPRVALLVQENKEYESMEEAREPFPPNPVYSLVAAAIGAYSEEHQRSICRRDISLPPKTYAGMTITRSYPVFYKIPVTQELVQAVAAGQWPQHQTVVEEYGFTRSDYVHTMGLVDLDCRYHQLACLEAFKPFVFCHRAST